MERFEKLSLETSYAQKIPTQAVAAVRSSFDERFVTCTQHCGIVSSFLFLFIRFIVWCNSLKKNQHLHEILKYFLTVC